MFKNSGRKLVISLKSSSVELSVIDVSKTPTLLFSNKETLLYREIMTPEKFISKSTTALEKIIRSGSMEIIKSLKGSHDCEIIFHSPWFFPELISKENKNKTISLKNFFKESVTPPEQKEYAQIENKITNILLNGYNLDKIKDVKGENIEMNLFRSFVKEETLKGLRKLIKSNLPLIKDFEFNTSAMQFYETLKDIFPHEDNFMFFSIGGEITEIGIIENDILRAYHTVPIGSHEFSRELDTFIGEKGNLSTLSFLSDKATDEKLDSIKKDKVDSLRDYWSREIINTLKEDGGELPHRVFLIANSDSTQFFNMIIKECKKCEEFDFYLITKEVFDKRVEIQENKESKNNVEYLLSTYYLSIKN